MKVSTIAFLSGATILVIALVLVIGTIIWYYAGNFVLNVFDIKFQLTWAQAFGCQIIFMILRGLFVK